MTPKEFYEARMSNWCAHCKKDGHRTDECPLGIKPIPRSEWPIWVNAIALWHDDSDAGIGDTVRRCLGKFGEMFKAILKKLGVECGCDARRNEWNKLYPYNNP
jgi:hypothetical protein